MFNLLDRHSNFFLSYKNCPNKYEYNNKKNNISQYGQAILKL